MPHSSSPKFDKDTSVVIIHSPNIGELYQTREAIKQSELIIYKPVPCLLSHSDESVQIVWLGILNESDESWLNAKTEEKIYYTNLLMSL
jgi:hypothetical protein